jgi:bifunctional non-homologous end joining protein LigD
MLATPGGAPLDDPGSAYEPKYDGIRAIVEVDPVGPAARARIWSRQGNEKSAQFPEIITSLARVGQSLEQPVILDGEIVALDESGEPASFTRLQGRLQVSHARQAGALADSQPSAFVAFDLLRDGAEDLRVLPLRSRRARLDSVLRRSVSPLVRLSEFVVGDGRELYARAQAQGWEGVIAKRLDSRYASGQRTSDWHKLKLTHRQEFIVGGWTEPRGTRSRFGALLVGTWRDDVLEFAGGVGTGFDEREIERVWRRLAPREVDRCPFGVRPATIERPHWVTPGIVVEVRFAEWTPDGRLRHPVYLGLRDDVAPENVKRESVGSGQSATDHWPPTTDHVRRPLAGKKAQPAPDHWPPTTDHVRRPLAGEKAQPAPDHWPLTTDLAALLSRLEELEKGRGAGIVTLPGGERLEVSNLGKVFWPEGRVTKGELLRHYVRVAAVILPAVADRPLVMKRFPNGIEGEAFYQQRAPEKVPAGVRVETLPDDEEVPSRLVGGSLLTLLYMTQLAAISQDPWFSRVGSPASADHFAFDLDPMPGVPFQQVLDVARWLRDELALLRVSAFPKTSGADGLHIYVPLRPGTPYEAGMLFSQIVATLVADRHPREATVVRAVSARGRTVYIDCLQNIRGKTLATAYSARASAWAGVSTPLTWEEVGRGLDPREFTLRTFPGRLKQAGDLWAGLRRAKAPDLIAALDKVKSRFGRR